MAQQLSDYFQKIAYKQLSAVETDPDLSHQHEFNGISDLKEIFGTQKREIEVAQIYLDDVSEDPLFVKNSFTWYDARENHPSRTEFRLYYRSNEVTQAFQKGDLMLLAQRPNGQFLNIIARGGSSAENQVKILFGLSEVTDRITTQTIAGNADKKMDFIREFIIEKLGITDENVYKDESVNYLEEMLAKFPDGLPTTKVFSDYSRSTVQLEDNDPDYRLIQWWERETQLFKLYEKHLFESSVNKDMSDIDKFLALSLSIHNTRKSRAGSAFENHVEQILLDEGIDYTRTPKTENNNKPDFIFPNIEAYKDMSFPADKLYMLGAKTSCKDRWRQVLSEAERIHNKHLLTLEPGISQNQTDEMKSQHLTLVIPESIQYSYNDSQREEIMNLKEFLNIIR